mmetsp:Transcript_99883/g.280864  ORF Transcript_99883/g.280864 Transcript_99883/m.280864 type:complete len:200 (-) Transcript_99883:641-1240(-)
MPSDAAERAIGCAGAPAVARRVSAAELGPATLLPTALQLGHELGEVADGVDDGPQVLRDGHCFVPGELREVHKADAACRACSVGTGEAVHHHVLAVRERVGDELQHRQHEVDGVIVCAHLAVVAGDVKPQIRDPATALVVQRHVVRAVDDMCDLVLLQELQVRRSCLVADVEGGSGLWMSPQGVQRIVRALVDVAGVQV